MTKMTSPHAKIARIEEELKVLKARLSQLVVRKANTKRFADIEGLWKGKTDLSFQDIHRAEIRFKDES